MPRTRQDKNLYLILIIFLHDALSRNCHHFYLIVCQELLFCLIVLRHLHRSFLSMSNKMINIVTVDFVAFQMMIQYNNHLGVKCLL